MMPFRIGHGFDVHKFGEGDHVILGGVSIPYSQGLIAHSDGDVVLHALTDALLGAAALGDIGKHFPDTDAAFSGADSRILLKRAFAEIKALGLLVGNLDVTILAQAPKMRPHIDAMRANIAEDLEVDVSQVNVKATTTEKLGFTGRKEGIAVEAVALLHKQGAL
ncbi:2-C-methyl-D-erythritol 2,4-cyclodiphosphate synthase [Marinomonas posidonica]|uniref:2-C-methyl-D-erythritol 2,4-cyclodiphosphate synthase n=1 Tax=Marinomonas posidonica (strain CECT 7376 / NCIMB 14433 / IVIA-Po-181) TaxID=491952 RepID=F6CY02_MARPP|nr:2-C-methyl-D-erythritol 2,4-cyclodiphosphate synthase [Marinomonas posidonica]AEF55634.1 2-C-methyl-D-erythritol 2,4-cyclodiphosphate synthase [Marinomonas posidonica IVIA-Po-181]